MKRYDVGKTFGINDQIVLTNSIRYISVCNISKVELGDAKDALMSWVKSDTPYFHVSTVAYTPRYGDEKYSIALLVYPRRNLLSKFEKEDWMTIRALPHWNMYCRFIPCNPYA